MVFRVRDVRELRIRGTAVYRPDAYRPVCKMYFSTRADKVFVWCFFVLFWQRLVLLEN